MKRFLALAALAIAGCGTLPQKPPYLTGDWGGQHVGMSIEGGIARLEYDCASGTIDSWIVPGPEGRFRANGTHMPGQGGPVRVGQIFTTHRAEYIGTVQGDVMELTVRLEDGDVLGPFSLTQSQPPQITRCL